MTYKKLWMIHQKDIIPNNFFGLPVKTMIEYVKTEYVISLLNKVHISAGHTSIWNLQCGHQG